MMLNKSSCKICTSDFGVPFLLSISREIYNRKRNTFGLSGCLSPGIFSEAGFSLCEDFKGLGVRNCTGGKTKKTDAFPWASVGDVPALIPPRKLSDN